MEIEMCRGLFALLQIGPVLSVMIRRIDVERHLVHMTFPGPNVRSVFEFEDELICIAL